MNFVGNILNYLAALLIAPTIPTMMNPNWQYEEKWVPDGEALSFSATSRTIGEECSKDSNQLLFAPTIMQGFHEFYADGRLVATSGDKSFKRGSSLYNSMTISCKLLAGSSVVTWKVINLTHSYAKLDHWPKLVAKRQSVSMFNTGVQAASAGALLFIGFLCSGIFFGRLPRAIPVALLGASLFIGAFFTLSIPELFSLNIPTLHLHRLHDAALWIGTIFIWILFNILCNVPKALQRIHFTCVFFALVVIALSTTLDQSQVGSTIAFLGNLVCLFACVLIQVANLSKNKISRMQTLQFLSVCTFCIAGINDILINAGVLSSIPLFTIGVTFSFILVALTANEKIAEIHRERDHLKAHLESEVKEKTKSLEESIRDLKQAQAELLQSSKLAALGTLSAGLAHEINNSLNYPTGALPVLKRIVEKQELTDKDRKKAAEILALMNNGLTLTSEIIKNLKRYSSGKPGETEIITLKQVIEGSLLLLRNQLREGDGIDVKVNVDDNFVLFASRVGLSQILMNIISNSADALKDLNREKKEISIDATETDKDVTLTITDNGQGIPLQHLDKILDPFFTTKAPGKGTGLGLYIVSKEMTALGGHLEVKSQEGHGTSIILHFPKKQSREAA